jgi:hypothetical protein
MAVRYRWSCQVLYGKYAEFMELQSQKTGIARAHEWVQATYWEAVAGRVNDFFLEREYESLEQLAAETEARDTDYEFMRAMRATYPLVAQGSIKVEIFESVDPTAPI